MIWIRIGHERIPLRQGETTVGRSPYCSIVIDSPTASRHHAALMLNGIELTVTDLGSRNGTNINGTRITTTTALNVGDVLTIGSRELTVLSSETGGGYLSNTEERMLPTPPHGQSSALAATVEDTHNR
jgi:pSer/pThr/pTyr-binding forkhead associated (FHA) protein